MIEAFQIKHPKIKQPASSIFVESVATPQKLWELSEQRLPQLLNNSFVKLIVIDSIAGLFRSEFSNEESIERSKLLWKQANQLKLLSDTFNVPIVIVNQVSDLFSRDSNNNNFHFGQASVTAKKIPALGLAWSNCINTRVLLERTSKKMVVDSNTNEYVPKKRKVEEDNINNNSNNPLPNQQSSTTNPTDSKPSPLVKNPNNNNNSSNSVPTAVRKLHVILASHIPNNSCSFIVTREGVQGIENLN